MRFLNWQTLKGLAQKRHHPGDVLLGAGTVLLLWAFLYFLLGFTFNFQHVCEVLIGVAAPAWILIRSYRKTGQGAAQSVIPAVARFALVGVAVAVVGILVTISWFDGSPSLLGAVAGILIGAFASVPGAVAVMFAADLVCYFRETRSKN